MTNRYLRMRPLLPGKSWGGLKRAVFIGCRICGATDVTLRRSGDGYLCPACLAREQKEGDLHG